MIDKSGLFMVYNYGRSPVCVRTRYDSILFEGSDGNSPVSKPLSFEEIAYINSNTNAFKVGLLTFDEENQKELNEELRNRDWESVLTDEQIKDIILNPTADGLNKILAIKSHQYFDRVRGMHVYLSNKGYDISSKVTNTIRSRYQEIKKGILNTRIEVVLKDSDNSSQKKINDLEAEIKALKEMLKQSTIQSTPEQAQAQPTDKKKKTRSQK